MSWSGLKLGQDIGYQTGPMKRKAQRGFLYMTDGVLLQRLLTLKDEQICSRYSTIIIDEVHSRTIGVDLVLYHIKKLLERYHTLHNCPVVILVSATFETESFLKYFGTPRNHVLQVLGRTFPITTNWRLS